MRADLVRADQDLLCGAARGAASDRTPRLEGRGGGGWVWGSGGGSARRPSCSLKLRPSHPLAAWRCAIRWISLYMYVYRGIVTHDMVRNMVRKAVQRSDSETETHSTFDYQIIITHTEQT